MTRDRDKQLLTIANASGFPFQLGVKHHVERALGSRGWRVLVTEHPWTDPDTGRVEFIDMVLERDSIRLVIECKRVRQGQWVFLHESNGNETPSPSINSRVFVTFNPKAGDKGAGWKDCYLQPGSFESSYCAVRGSGEGQRPLLERLAATVCKATEALGIQELSLEPTGDLDLCTVYVPVIVTSAEVIRCVVGPEPVDIGTGDIAESNATFESAGCVRFRKPLALLADLSRFADVGAVNHDAERTVLIVNSVDLLDSLGDIRSEGFVPDHPRWYIR